MSKLREELCEMLSFNEAKIVTVPQFDSHMHIAHYKIGPDHWITLFEDYDGEVNYTRVNVTERGIVELYKILKEIMEK